MRERECEEKGEGGRGRKQAPEIAPRHLEPVLVVRPRAARAIGENICPPSRESCPRIGRTRWPYLFRRFPFDEGLKIECRHKSSPIRERVLNVRTSPLPRGLLSSSRVSFASLSLSFPPSRPVPLSPTPRARTPLLHLGESQDRLPVSHLNPFPVYLAPILGVPLSNSEYDCITT